MTGIESRPTLTDGDSDLGYRIVTEVARREGTDPLALEVPLYEVVDVDAMASILHSAGPDTTITFRYVGREVTVSGDGSVVVGADGHDETTGD